MRERLTDGGDSEMDILREERKKLRVRLGERETERD